MGRKSKTGGVTAAGPARIRFDFQFEGVRYRPTLRRTPTETNLRRARQQLDGIDKDSTKTGEDQRIELCPRALQVLNRQLALRARLELAGKINHDQLFFKETGEPIRNLQYPYVR